VSRPTIVKALSSLRQDGWIDTQQGRGSFVRGRPALAGAERTRPAHSVLELPETSLSGELVQAGVKLAPGYVTRLLGLEPGRRRSCGSGCSATTTGRSSWPRCGCRWSWPPGPSLASPDLLDESIRHHLQARKKIRFDHAVERISARQPTGEEAGLLRSRPIPRC
jgi:DNA-binding GntR family transcriptional regulator